MAATTALATYLQDHHGGAVMGCELANKLSSDYPELIFLAELERDIEADKATLERLMSALEVSPAPLKELGGWIGEKVSRLKLSEMATGDRDLKQLMEFEVLSLGIEGKLALWHSLLEVGAQHPELDKFDLPALADRAQHQRDDLESHRRGAAGRALTDRGRALTDTPAEHPRS